MIVAKMKSLQFYTDHQLLELIADGNQDAFMQIYDRYWKKVFSVANNRMNKLEDAEDIVNDVFASLWANREKLQIDSLENYLATASKYCVFAKIKLQNKEREYAASLHQQVFVTDSCENSVHYKRILLQVKKEVEKLPEKCQLIFKYSREQGLSVKEIASILEISPKTVENQIGKAIKQLRVSLRTILPFWVIIVIINALFN
jgi:RNA polymerase sigma-70 factor (family 1)